MVDFLTAVLTRAKTRRHHFIFGRRGSGKSSLLNKLRSELSLERMPVAYIDLEAFKGHSYPDVLISILIKTLDSYSEWLETAGVFPATKQSFWQKVFGSKPREKSLEIKSIKPLIEKINSIKGELNHLLLEPEEVERTRTARKTRSHQTSSEGGIASSKINIKLAANENNDAEKEISDNYSSKKIETLHRRILDFKSLLENMSSVCSKPCFLLLDDLYHIRPSHQSDVVDYFHRITKGANTWLKIGTIKHRTKWYKFGTPPIGMKLGDDADEIDLDVTLEKYDLTKEFLGSGPINRIHMVAAM